MKRNSKSNSKSNSNGNSNNNNSNLEGVKAMKRNSKSNSNGNSNNNNSNLEGVKAMKRNSKSNSKSNSNNNNPALQAAQILAALDPAILKAIGLTPAKTRENLKEHESTASESEPKSQKADRAYEIPSIGGDFVKSGIYARPTSEAAAQYVAKAKALCSDVIDDLTAPIAKEIATITEKAENNGGDTLKNDLLLLAEKWEIPAQSMRVVMQLCAPVVGVCNPETDEIARRVYGMGRANSLMGSACNTLMYSKAPDKEKAIPFKRVGHNVTALGLDFEECESVEDCNFCDEDEDFSELVALCDMWLAKCKAKNPSPEKSEAKSALRRAAKSEAAPTVEDKSAAILAALQALLNK